MEESRILINLNIGCGDKYLKGWINIDIHSQKSDLKHDVRKKFPFDNNYADFAYSEHMIEHLYPSEGISMIKNVMEVIKKDGVFRIATFDLNDIVEGYKDGSWKKWGWVKAIPGITTKAHMMNGAFYWWEHKWLYDSEELIKIVQESGFNKFKLEKINSSEHIELRNLETRENSTLVIEVIK